MIKLTLNKIEPDMEFIQKRLKRFRKSNRVSSSGGVSAIDKRMEIELAFLQVQEQNRLIEAIKENSKSSDKLARAQVILAYVAAGLGLIQIIFINLDSLFFYKDNFSIQN